MHTFRENNIVKTVYTYTANEQLSAQKPKRKGITRIAQINLSSSKEKPHLIRHSQYVPINNENFNYSNRKNADENHSHEELQMRVRELESQLVMVRKEKEELEMQHKEQKGLVESQYIACNEDLDKWVNEKHELQVKIGNLEVENNFLKMNVGIQEQFMIKVQKQNDQLKQKQQQWKQKDTQTMNKKDKQFWSSSQFNIQINQYSKQIKPVLLSLRSQVDLFIVPTPKRCSAVQKDIQCQLEIPLNYKELAEFSQQMDRKTHQVTLIVQDLTDQNIDLKLQKEQLMNRIIKLQSLQDQYMEESNQKISKLKNELIKASNELESAYSQIERIQRQNSDRYENYSKRSNDQDAKYLLRKIDDFQNRNRSLEEENAILLQKLKDYSQEIARKEGKYHQNETELKGKSELIARLRDDIMDLSYKYEQKCRDYAKLWQDKVSLLQQFQSQQSLHQNTSKELEQLNAHYTAKINQIEHNLHQMELCLQEEVRRNNFQVEKNRLNECEFEEKMQVFKKDYNILYAKYIKYKNMCLILQGQKPQ